MRHHTTNKDKDFYHPFFDFSFIFAMNNSKVKHELETYNLLYFRRCWPTLLELLENEPVNQGQVLITKFQISYHPVPSYITRSEL